MKKIIEERAKRFQRIYTDITLEVIVDCLKDFTEHPTKSGYKRKDIELFINLISQNGKTNIR